ncbi:MAG: hypothetical protein AAF264_00595 [Pseudomonadota bacterium]
MTVSALSTYPSLHPSTIRAGRSLAVVLTAIATALVVALLVLDPFAAPNNHATPEMLAAWEEMMK